jgi:U3 small nucleolar ribonucleoprotein protein IMP4
LEEGKAIPTELRQQETNLRNELALEDAATAGSGAAADDEYAKANERDPKVPPETLNPKPPTPKP